MPPKLNKPIRIVVRPKPDVQAQSSLALEWAVKKPAGPKSNIVRDGRNVIHQGWTDGSETIEEYDVLTQRLLVRKHRKRTTLGADGEWVYEVGQETRVFNPLKDALAPSASNPIFTRCDTETDFEWRVRNCPWPLENYTVTVETEVPPVLVIRTANKKYFKRFDIPDLVRLSIPATSSALSFTHERNTLIIRYKKPVAAVKAADAAKSEASQLAKERTAATSGNAKAAEEACKQQ